MKRLFFIAASILFFLQSHAQVPFSVRTDLSVLRNFSPQQKFFAIGQTVHGDIHFSAKENLYASIGYYSPGKVKNNFVASAIDPTTSPAVLPYRVSAKFRFRELSIGLKHYFKGNSFSQENWNLYGMAGFGLLFSNIENVYSNAVDTLRYKIIYAKEGTGKFQRLTVDLGLGAELPLGGDIFLYTELRNWLPISNYPSPYLHRFDDMPLSLSIAGGIRVMFNHND